MSVRDWLDQAERGPGVQYRILDRASLVVSTQWDTLNGDPADRMLVAGRPAHRL